MPKNRIVDCFFIFALIVFSSATSTISNSDLALLVFFGFTLVYSAFKKNFLFPFNQLLYLTISLFLLVLFYFGLNSKVNIATWTGWIIRVLLAFLVVKINQNNFVKNFVYVCYWLTVVSLIGYGFQLIVPETLFKFNNWFGLEYRENSNSLFFNFTKLHFLRNSGCMWEPGAFAALLIIALIFIEFFIPEGRKKEKTIISIGILTTISTNGYLLLGLIYLFSFLYKASGNLKVWGLIVFFPLGVFTFYNTQILSSKIGNQLLEIEEDADRAFQNPNYVVSVNRFTSFVIDLPAFLERPLLGYGVDNQTVSKNAVYKTYGENVIRSSGLMTLLLSFGLLGTLFYFYLLYNVLFGLLQYRIVVCFFVLVMVFIVFSNPLGFSPILFSLFFIRPIIRTQSNNKRYIQNKSQKSI